MAYNVSPIGPHPVPPCPPHGGIPAGTPPDIVALREKLRIATAAAEAAKRKAEAAESKAEAAESIFIHEAMDFKFVAATEAEIYAMFDAEPPTPPVWDGYIDLSEVTISADGYIYVKEIRTDEDMYIKATGTFLDWDEEEDFVRLSDLIINSEGYMYAEAIPTDEDNYILTNAGATDSEGYLTD